MSTRNQLIPSAFLTLLLHLVSASPLPQNGDGGGSTGLPDGGLGYDPSAEGDTQPGSSGKDTGGVRLSKGAIIAIAIVAGIVVILGSKFSHIPFVPCQQH